MISDDAARGAILGYMEARCDVSSQHKLPGIDEIASTVFANFVGADRVREIVDQMLKDGDLIDYDGYISDHQIEVL